MPYLFCSFDSQTFVQISFYLLYILVEFLYICTFGLKFVRKYVIVLTVFFGKKETKLQTNVLIDLFEREKCVSKVAYRLSSKRKLSSTISFLSILNPTTPISASTKYTLDNQSVFTCNSSIRVKYEVEFFAYSPIMFIIERVL